MKVNYLLIILLVGFTSINSNVSIAGLTSVSRIEITPSVRNRQGWLQVSEVVARQTGTGNDLALSSAGASAFGSSNWPRSSPNFAIDGRAPDRFNRIFHSNENNRTSFLNIDLAVPSELDSIVLYGRTDCCSFRDIYNIRLFDAQGRVLYSRNNLRATNRRHRVRINLRGIINPFPSSPSGFNAFESGTAAGATTGRLFTKLAGVNFVADIVALNAGAQLSAFSEAVIVDLVANAGGASIEANNCPSSFRSIQTIVPNPIIAGGRATVGFPALPSAFRDVRVRIRYPVNSPTVTSCSTDNFVIRPTGLSVSSTATQTGTSGSPVIKTGANFSLTVKSVTGYDGTPIIDNKKIIGTPNAGKIGGNFTAASPVTGVASSKFYYTEVGNFGLEAQAIFDAAFTAVDQPNDCNAGFSNALIGGRYGCSFGSAAIPQITGKSGFGRFIPDNFALKLNTPQFQTACEAGRFTYIGQPFKYNTKPVITVIARNGEENGLTNETTLNYAGKYVKLTNASLKPNNQAARYLRYDAPDGAAMPALDTSILPETSVDPAIEEFKNGVGRLVFSAGATGLAFARSTLPSAPFKADIALAINVIDADDVAFAENPVSFGAATAGSGIAFSNGAEMRFGRLRLQNAFGSELLSLPVPITAQYWNGVGFVTNTLDQCTQINTANIGMTNYTGNLAPGATIAATGSSFVGGVGQLTLSAPGVANNGSVDLMVNLGASATEAPCISLAPDPVTTGANHSYLKSKWCGANFDKDPAARVTFGVYKSASEIIYIRELY